MSNFYEEVAGVGAAVLAVSLICLFFWAVTADHSMQRYVLENAGRLEELAIVGERNWMTDDVIKLGVVGRDITLQEACKAVNEMNEALRLSKEMVDQ